MGTPDFIVELRRHVGHSLLWLTGATAVVLRGEEHPEVLLVRRADNGRWTPVTGIVDPGEEVADAAVREVLEETGVRARALRLVRVSTSGRMTYPNGDVAQYVDLVFRCEWVSGDPHPADGENTEARWYRLEDLPEMTDEMHARIDAALHPDEPARFTGGEVPADS
ncbi:MAG: NUDIX hydrolase [Actinomycetaceae bacterium]